MVNRLEPTERRAQILDAAVMLAEDQGYHAVTRDLVASRAGISYGLVNRYFGTIEALKQKIMKAAVERGILKIIAAGLAVDDPIARSAPPALRTKAAFLISS